MGLWAAVPRFLHSGRLTPFFPRILHSGPDFAHVDPRPLNPDALRGHLMSPDAHSLPLDAARCPFAVTRCRPMPIRCHSMRVRHHFDRMRPGWIWCDAISIPFDQMRSDAMPFDQIRSGAMQFEQMRSGAMPFDRMRSDAVKFDQLPPPPCPTCLRAGAAVPAPAAGVPPASVRSDRHRCRHPLRAPLRGWGANRIESNRIRPVRVRFGRFVPGSPLLRQMRRARSLRAPLVLRGWAANREPRRIRPLRARCGPDANRRESARYDATLPAEQVGVETMLRVNDPRRLPATVRREVLPYCRQALSPALAPLLTMLYPPPSHRLLQGSIPHPYTASYQALPPPSHRFLPGSAPALAPLLTRLYPRPRIASFHIPDRAQAAAAIISSTASFRTRVVRESGFTGRERGSTKVR